MKTWLKHVITGDEIGCLAIMSKQKCSCQNELSLSQKKIVSWLIFKKVKMIVFFIFFDWVDIIYHEFLRIARQWRHLYLNVSVLREAVWWKIPENGETGHRWCTCLVVISYLWIFVETWDDCGPAAALHSRFCSSQIFFSLLNPPRKEASSSMCSRNLKNFEGTVYIHRRGD